MSQHQRTELLLGSESMNKLKNAAVAVFGVGGVGGFAVEALARAGVGKLHLVDNDEVNITNINRQIIALHSTIGMDKVDAARQRVLDINPEAEVTVYKTFFLPETEADFPFEEFDYVVDAIDTVTGKLRLAEICQAKMIPIISAMGAGNKLDPTVFEVTDIYKTSVCPLARVMRKECAKRHIKKLKVVYSKEVALEPQASPELIEALQREHPGKRALPGSVSFVPSVMGLILAGEVIKDLIQ